MGRQVHAHLTIPPIESASCRLPVECIFRPDGRFGAWFRVGNANLRESEQLSEQEVSLCGIRFPFLWR